MIRRSPFAVRRSLFALRFIAKPSPDIDRAELRRCTDLLLPNRDRLYFYKN